MKARELRQKLGELTHQLRAIMDGASKESRTTLNSDEEQRYGRIEEDITQLEASIKRAEALEAREAELATSLNPHPEHRTGPTVPTPNAGPVQGQVLEFRPSSLATRGSREHNQDWSPQGIDRWFSDLSPGQRATIARRESNDYRACFRASLMGGPTAIDSILRMPEARAVQMDIDVSGGYLIPPMQFVDTLIQAIDDKVFIRQRATVHQVVGSHSMGMPSLDADPANPVWTSELGTGDEDSSMAFGRRELVPKPLAKMIKISKKAIRARASIEALVKERLAYKFGITEENAFLNGSGVNQPLGLFTPSNDGIPTSRDVATGSSTNITGDALIDARYGVKDGYGEKGEWVLGRTGLKLVRKLKSSDNQYLWQPGLHGGNPSTILDRPYHLSEFSPDTWTTGLYVGLFGDLSYYHIADSLEMTFERLVELFALTNQNAYIGRLEADGMPVLAEAFVRLKTN